MNATTPTGQRWGRIIRERRQLTGMSQYALADELQVRQGAVSAWERGTRLPSRRNLRRLCQALGLPESAFIYDEVA